jgi:hypothetical protein
MENPNNHPDYSPNNNNSTNQPPINNDTINQAPPTQMYVAAPPKKRNGLGIAAMVLGIVSITFSWMVLSLKGMFGYPIITIALAIGGIIFGTVKKRSKGSAIAGLVLGIISITIMFAIYGVGGSLSDENSGESTGSNTPTVEEQVDDGTPVDLGTPISSSKFEITINSGSKSTRINDGSYLYYEPDAGNEFVVINIKLKNISNEMESFHVSDFQLLTLDKSIKYSPTSMIVTSGDETFFWSDSLNPATAKTGNIVFELPEGIDLTTLQLRYNDTWSLDTSYYFFLIQ